MSDEKNIESIRGDLTPKQIRFAEEYLIDLNATQAAIRSGYSEDTAAEIGYENLRKPQIVKYIELLMKERAEKVELTQNEVLRRLRDLAFGDITKTMDLTVEEFQDLPDNVRLCINRFEKNTRTFDKGEESFTETTIKVWFVDKLKAYDMLCKHIGFYEKDNKLRIEGINPPKIEFYKSEDE